MNRGVTIIVAAGILVITGLVIGLAIVASLKNKNVCPTIECRETAQRIIKSLNKSVKPCDNFYEFACGGFMNSASLDQVEISTSPFYITSEDIRKQLRTSIEEPSGPNEQRAFTLAKTVYKRCMNTSAIEEAGLEPLRKIHRELGSWPVLEGDNWKTESFNLIETLRKTLKLGYSSEYFLSTSVDVDWKNTSRYIITLDQASFGLPREYLVLGEKHSIVKAYYDFMVDVAVILGAERQRATRELEEALEFELKLVNITSPEEERRNFTLLSNPMNLTELGKRYPSVDWMHYINDILPPNVRVDLNEVVDVREPEFISELEKLLRKTPKRVQANYAIWRVTLESVPFLNERMRKRRRDLISAISGNILNQKTPRWQECLAIVNGGFLSIASSAMYVRKYFKEGTRQNAIEMVGDLREELLKILGKADWMDEKTRNLAREKAEAMISLIAYPAELLDDKKLENLYADFNFSSDNYLENVLHMKQSDNNFTLQLLRKPVNKSDWIIHDYSTEVNTLYHILDNSIIIPASVLQGAFFSNDRPRYMNYGAIGFLIGHEMSHSFDTAGKQFDKDGNLVDWWTPETEERYLEKTRCIIDQYNNYTVEAVGLQVNGARTLAENIADNGGIKTSYLAYKEYVKKNGPEQKLPGLEYTPEQMFWISAASIWCTRYRPEAALFELTVDPHSPERFRVIGPLSNMPEFANDFKCPVGSYMNPVHKCTVF